MASRLRVVGSAPTGTRLNCSTAVSSTAARCPVPVRKPASRRCRPSSSTAATTPTGCPGASRKSGPGPGRGNGRTSRRPGGGGGGGSPWMTAERWATSCSWVSSWPTRYRYSATSVAAPMPTHTAANSSTCPASSRVRSEKADRLRRGFEDITGPAQGVDHRVPTAVDLLAQIGDVELDDVGAAPEVVAPHPVEDLRLAQHPFGVLHEVAQQLEFGGGQRDRIAGAGHFVTVLVENEVADDDLCAGVGGAHPGAPQQAPQPQHHLFEAERFGDVVVAAGGQPGDAVLHGVLGGEKQHRKPRVDAA